MYNRLKDFGEASLAMTKNLTIVTSDTAKRIPIEEVNADVTIWDLLDSLAKKINLPPGTTAVLTRDSTGEQLLLGKTVGELGISDGESLIVDFERVAGQVDTIMVKASKPDDILSLLFPLPPLISVEKFFSEVVETLSSIEYMYSFLTVFYSGNTAIKGLIEKIKINDNNISKSQLNSFLESIKSEPLRLVRFRYGSPASLDLLGVGKVLEIIRDIIKDMTWRGEHEKFMSDLEQQGKQLELQKAELENKRVAIENSAKNLEIEKTEYELISKQIDLLERMANVQLAEGERQLLISTLIPKLARISNNQLPPLLKSEEKIYRVT
jgi:hypothetical protein